MVIKYLLKFFLVLFFFVSHNHSKADFFKDITSQIDDNNFRLSYGISVTDVNQDNKYEFVVTGFGFSNLALAYQNGKIININENEKSLGEIEYDGITYILGGKKDRDITRNNQFREWIRLVPKNQSIKK